MCLRLRICYNDIEMIMENAVFDDDLPRHKQPVPFPRKLEGMSVGQMQEYKAELLEEIVKIEAEIENRGGVKAAAESLFR